MQLPNIERKQEYLKNGIPVIPATNKQFTYHFLTRNKKSHPWKSVAFAYCAGDVCLAVAEDYFKIHGYISDNYSLAKVVDGATWHKYEVTQHLKMVNL